MPDSPPRSTLAIQGHPLHVMPVPAACIAETSTIDGPLDHLPTDHVAPLGPALDGKGALLIAGDVGGTVWRVSAAND